jgi:PGF-pre-PGF domain-containing protein
MSKMKREEKIAISILFVFVIVILINFTSAATRNCWSCGNCTAEIAAASTGDIVQLNQSVNVSGTCITFAQNYITFDCLNYSNFMRGDGTDSNGGIFFNGVFNDTVRNCNLSQFYYGIYLSVSNNNTFINITANNNTDTGVMFINSNNNTLKNLILKNNLGNGIFLGLGSKNNWITNLTSQENSLYDVKFGSTNLISSCDNNFTNINGSGGRAIEFYNYSAVIENKTLSELILCNADYSRINNITIQSSSALKNNGVISYYTDNTNFSNINSSNTNYGMDLEYFNNNILTNIIANNNSAYGMELDGNNSILTNSIFNNNVDGIVLSSANNNILINMLANNNSYGGILLQSSYNNTFTNVTTNNNTNYGLYFFVDSSYNTIKNSFIEYNSKFGLYFYSGGAGYPRFNLFYNNYFNNTAQYSNSTNLTNFFNTTKIVGANIVGGSYIGGNYWAALNGSGFSQICSSSTDGICDTAYSLDGVNYDYLPLTCIESWSCDEWSTCSNDVQTRTCTDANFCQTYKYKPEESQACSSGGDSSIGGATQTNLVASISPDEPAIIQVTGSGFGARKITINTNKMVYDVSLTIKEVNSDSAGFQTGFSGFSFEAFEITVKNLTNEDINNETIEFRVNKTELLSHNLTTEDVFLYRRQTNETGWAPLNTTFLSDQNGYYTFSAVSPGFSTFLVFVSETECIPSEKRCFENQVQFCLGNKKWLVSEVCDYQCKDGKCVEKGLQVNLNPLIVYPIIGMVVVGVLISFMAQRMPKKKRESFYGK